jgi:hypothetical protein
MFVVLSEAGLNPVTLFNRRHRIDANADIILPAAIQDA